MSNAPINRRSTRATVASFAAALIATFALGAQAQNVTRTINETLDTTVPAASAQYTSATGTQTGRMNRFAVVSTCGAAKGYPGTFVTTGARQYDAYTFPAVPTARCVVVSLTSPGNTNLFVAAYGNFNPADVGTGYLGDPGSSAQSNLTISFGVDVPAGQPLTVVVHEVNVGGAPNQPYTLVVSSPAEAELGISLSGGAPSVSAGDTVSYTITATNAGPTNAFGATVTDTFPATLTCTWTCAGANGGTCNTANGTGVTTLTGTGNINQSINLRVGGTTTFTAVCTATASDTLSNTATIAAPTGFIDPVLGNNSATLKLNPPANITVSLSAGTTGGTASPLGITQIGYGGSLDVMITANPRYVALVGGTCLGRIITSVALVPQGAGSSIYRTDATNGDCTIVVSFRAVQPVITVSGNGIATLPNATPAQTFSEVGKPATFTAKLSGAIGVLNFFNTAPTPVFIAFQADGVAIAGCAQQAIIRTFRLDETLLNASCTTTALSLGIKVITASFNGDNYNFPATTSATATPTQALTHVIIAVGAPPPAIVIPPVVIPPVVVPPVVPPNSTTLPTVPVSLPPITLTLRPVAVPAATSQTPSNPAAANGSVSPNGVGGSNGAGGVVEVAFNAAIDLSITANPRYLAQVSGTCGGRIITSTSLVPQGAGSNTYRTAEVGSECTVIISFTPAIPTITVSGSNRIAPVNTTPVMSTSTADQPATFKATLRQAIGVVGLNNASPSTVFISFYAGGAPIVGCEQQIVTPAYGLDDSYYQATCSTASLSIGEHKITVSFSGDRYNFPAITDSNKTPTPVLTHVVR